MPANMNVYKREVREVKEGEAGSSALCMVDLRLLWRCGIRDGTVSRTVLSA